MFIISRPEIFWYVIAALILGPMISVCYYRKKSRFYRQAADFKFSRTRDILIVVLFNALILFGGLALLGVKYNSQESYAEKRGADICFIFDITYSMQAQNRDGAKTTRMERMLEIFDDILVLLEDQPRDNRVTAVAFGWEAWNIILFPTNDFRLVRREVAGKINLKNSYIKGREGSNIGIALLTGVTSFPEANSGEEERKKIIILLSDGEPDGNISEIQRFITNAVTDYAKKKKIYAEIIGIGDPSREFPLPKLDKNGDLAGYEKDDKGRLKKTRSDFSFLSETARKINGDFLQDSGVNRKNLNSNIIEKITDATKTGKIVTATVQKDITIYLLALCSALAVSFLTTVLIEIKKT